MSNMNAKELTDRLRLLLCRITSASSSVNFVAKQLVATPIMEDGDTLCSEIVLLGLASGMLRDTEEGFLLIENLEKFHSETQMH